jgi:hypothetical protein
MRVSYIIKRIIIFQKSFIQTIYIFEVFTNTIMYTNTFCINIVFDIIMQ